MNRNIKILCVDDDEDDFLIFSELCSEIPGWKIELQWVPSIKDAQSLLSEQLFDLCFIDYYLGSDNGLSLLSNYTREKDPAPRIMLTGNGDPDVEIAAIKMGAADYLVKQSLDTQNLERSIRFTLERKRVLNQLKRSNEELRELDNIKAELLASVSHELLTPLTTIRETLSLIYDGVLGKTSEDQNEMLRIGINSTKHLERVISDLLDLSVLTDGRLMVLESDAFGIGEVVREAVLLTASKAKQKRQQIKANFPDKDFACLGDRRRILQVLINLITNASKFSEEDETIECGWERINADSVRIYVRDHGTGIAPEHRTKIFDKFVRIRSEDNEHIEGTGLGLYLCRKIIEAHSGKIGVDSELGEGSRFYFDLKIESELELEAETMEQ